MSNSDDKGKFEPQIAALLKQERALSGLREYHAGLDQVIASALGRVRIFDRHLGREFNSQDRIELMRKLLLANKANRIAIVVHDPGNIRSDCPRLVGLQRQFGHALAIHRTLSLARGVYDPFCVADGSNYARRFHHDSMRGILVLNDPDRAGDLVQRFEEIWEASQAAVTATTLGL
jgi:hypothetical protein